MKLSIIIVNYNVKFFLEQCLAALERALGEIRAEVIVVDNNSTDGSIDYLKDQFPAVGFMPLHVNLGFAKANNLALKKATGDFVLFLNPDTIIAEDTLTTCLHFFDTHAEAGALGVRMLNGSGEFLPESKRSFPSPFASLCKLSGLSALFPKSAIFARYHLGHLDAGSNHSVEVLAGAFMMIRKKVLKQTGGFDERFFMYGEDIDLSYRIISEGWKNYYLADTSIIHFKGESTKKGSLNYVRIFYQAMILFVKKHFRGAGAFLFRILLQLAIIARALISIFSRFLSKAGLPFMDIIVTMLCLFGVMAFWYAEIKTDMTIAPWLARLAFPLFSGVLIVAGYLSGLYDAWYKPRKAFSALLVGVIIILAAYSLLPEAYRFSRGIILIAGLLSTFSILLLRQIFISWQWMKVEDGAGEIRQSVVAGSSADYAQVESLFAQWGGTSRLLGRIDPAQNAADALGSLPEVEKAKQSFPFRELIFCLGDALTAKNVIGIAAKHPQMVRYKFHFAGTKSLVGSDTIQSAGEVLSATSHFNLAKPQYKRIKRVFDVLCALLLLFSMPVQLLLQQKPGQLLRNILAVLASNKTWIGYSGFYVTLPLLKPGILGTNGQPPVAGSDAFHIAAVHAIDERYAADYDWVTDFKLVWKNMRNLGA